MSEPRPTFGALVEERRKALGLSQEQLAREVGCGLRGMQRIESGEVRSPNRVVLARIAKRLGLSIEDLETGAGKDGRSSA